MEQTENLLELDGLTKMFSIRQGFSTSKFLAVDNASLSLQNDRPEIFTLAGESGSGKTTLARMILGLERPSDGHMYYKGREVAHLSGREKRAWFLKDVQPIFQDPFATFSPLKRIDSYLYETAYNYKMATKANVDEYINEHYHQPSDELRDDWNYDGALQQGEFLLRLTLRIADAQTLPQWNPGDEFASARNAAMTPGP